MLSANYSGKTPKSPLIPAHLGDFQPLVPVAERFSEAVRAILKSEPAHVQGHRAMELAAVLSNPEVTQRLEQLQEAIAGLGTNLARHRVKLRSLPLAQGQILGMIKQVLAAYPDGLQAFEVKRIVELELGRKLPRSTVRSALVGSPSFERIGHGRYRLKR